MKCNLLNVILPLHLKYVKLIYININITCKIKQNRNSERDLLVMYKIGNEFSGKTWQSESMFI